MYGPDAAHISGSDRGDLGGATGDLGRKNNVYTEGTGHLAETDTLPVGNVPPVPHGRPAAPPRRGVAQSDGRDRAKAIFGPYH